MEYDYFYLIMMALYGLGGTLGAAAAGFWINLRRRQKPLRPAQAALMLAVILLAFAGYMNYGYNSVLGRVERYSNRLESNPNDLLARRELERLCTKFGDHPTAQRTKTAIARAHEVMNEKKD